MNSQSKAMPEAQFAAQAIAPTAVSPTRLMYWSVHRELWENRSIYIGPLAAAAVFLFGFLISTIHLPRNMRAVLALDPAQQHAQITQPYNFSAGLILATAFIVGVFYCLDALHGERRDRSILFWKSLPVSDVITVLSKATIPLMVLPLAVFVIVLGTQWIMLLLSTVILLMNGLTPATLWTQLKFGESSLALLYGLTTMAVWHAPIYCWLLLVSGWARRTTFLWAFLPPVAVCILEKIALNSTHFALLLRDRLIGWFPEAFTVEPSRTMSIHPLASLTPGKFLTTPGLWIGLVFAALFLAAATRLRRYRGPI